MMDNPPSPPANNSNAQAPEAEALQPRVDNAGSTAGPAPPAGTPATPQDGKKPLRRSYRPSHKATFIGLAVVFGILAINAVIFAFVLKKHAQDDALKTKGQVTISSADLSRLGIDRNSIGDAGVQLIVAPDAEFKGKLEVGGQTVISGTLNLNSKLTGTDASLAKLQAGDTQLSKLNVNGDGTLSTLNLRQTLVVAGQTQLQGPVTLAQLLTVSNNANIAGNLAVGGTLSANNLSIRNLTVNGHLLTSGPTPGVSRGSAVGSNGTVSISGNDAAGTVAINIGVGAGGGILANVSFHSSYSGSPRVVITPVGIGGSFYVTNLSTGGFSIGINSGLPSGGYRINYIVAQ